MKISFHTTLLASALTAGAAMQIDTSHGEFDYHIGDADSDADIVSAIEKMNTDTQEAIMEAAKFIVGAVAEDCDELGGTDSDALEFDEFENKEKQHILKHALWVETSFIPRMECLQRQGKLEWYEDLEKEWGCFHEENSTEC